MSEIHPSAVAVGRALVLLLPEARFTTYGGDNRVPLIAAATFLRDPATLHWADGMDQHGYTNGLRAAIDTFLANWTLDHADTKH